MGSRRTRGDLKEIKDQWKEPYYKLVEGDEAQKKIDDFWEAYRE